MYSFHIFKLLACGKHFLFKAASNASSSGETTPRCNSSQQSFTGFFHTFNETVGNNQTLQEETFMRELEKEIDSFSRELLQNDCAVPRSVVSSSQFWLEHKDTFPQLAQLALIIGSIPSSFASIERYFSVCGFVSKKIASNIEDDLYTARCTMRANIDLLKTIKSVQY